MKTKYKYHTDPGHGWIAVKRAELIRLNILNEITPWSYQKGKTVYLEEDCDANIFQKAKRIHKEKIEIINSYRDYTPIRNYESFAI